MAFWDGYFRSLKPLDVEEPIDVWVHRPLAYVLAKSLLPTPITPNMVTVCSIAWGLGASLCMVRDFPHHLQWAGLSLFLSAVFDCADGQLARMRGTSSPLGRMLDGAADLVVSSVSVCGGTYLVWQKLHTSTQQGVAVLAVCLVTIVTGSFHTSMYDHYKNLYLRFTHPSYREGEDYETALERYRATRRSASFWVQLAWPIYLFYVSRQLAYVRRYDPNTRTAFSKFPPYDPEQAPVYREHMGPLMRVWRNWFGFGSLVFGMSVSIGFNVVEYYMVFRLVLLNLAFYAYVRPRQRLASAAAFRALGF